MRVTSKGAINQTSNATLIHSEYTGIHLTGEVKLKLERDLEENADIWIRIHLQFQVQFQLKSRSVFDSLIRCASSFYSKLLQGEMMQFPQSEIELGN